LGQVWVGFGSEFRKSSGFGLVLVFQTIFQFGFCFVLTEPKNHFAKILQLFSQNFYQILQKKKKYKNLVLKHF
jgi:hypothetical protein